MFLAELQNISKHYTLSGSGIEHPVLNGISLSISPDESIAITGPSGSGKSTLLNILGTLDRPSSGRVIIHGSEIGDLDEKHLAGMRNRMIGFVFQRHYLLPQLTLKENVLLPLLPQKNKNIKNAACERTMHLLEKVGLARHLHQRPSELSLGECQRAALVRALVNQPGLLLADEPTGSLDAENAAMLGELLIDLKKEHHLSMVVVTHSMELARMMEKYYKLASGHLTLISQ